MTSLPAPIDARPLDAIADDIRSAWEQGKQHALGAADVYLRVGADLAEARERFPDDIGYGRWFKAQGFQFRYDWGYRLRLLSGRADDYREAVFSALKTGRPVPGVDAFLKSVGLLGTGSERRLPGPPPDLTGDTRYGIIYADPPWPMPNWVESRDLERHYPTMTMDDILAMPVAGIASDDAVLYLWAISTHLHEAFHVIEAWGFEYVAQMVWVKDRIGTGWWVRHQHELLLIGRRGEVSPPPAAERTSSVISLPVRAHSEKPDEVADYIAGLWPDVPRVELFARREREGWAVIGDEVAS